MCDKQTHGLVNISEFWPKNGLSTGPNPFEHWSGRQQLQRISEAFFLATISCAPQCPELWTAEVCDNARPSGLQKGPMGSKRMFQ